MKPFVIFVLWAMLGWDVGAWVEGLAGIPTAVGILVGVALGAAFAVWAQRRLAVTVDGVPQAAELASPFEGSPALDRAA